MSASKFTIVLVYILLGLTTFQLTESIPLRWKRAFSYIANETACTVDHIVYRDGDPIPTDDPCEVCKCRPPGFSCVLRECEVKTGCRAIRRIGVCCPQYQCGCEHNGKYYQDGERIPNAESPCYSCYCQGSSITCSLADCKFRFDCEPEYIIGECCPRYDHCPPEYNFATPIATTLNQTTTLATTTTTKPITTSPATTSKIADKTTQTALNSMFTTLTSFGLTSTTTSSPPIMATTVTSVSTTTTTSPVPTTTTTNLSSLPTISIQQQSTTTPTSVPTTTTVAPVSTTTPTSVPTTTTVAPVSTTIPTSVPTTTTVSPVSTMTPTSVPSTTTVAAVPTTTTTLTSLPTISMQSLSTSTSLDSSLFTILKQLTTTTTAVPVSTTTKVVTEVNISNKVFENLEPVDLTPTTLTTSPVPVSLDQFTTEINGNGLILRDELSKQDVINSKVNETIATSTMSSEQNLVFEVATEQSTLNTGSSLVSTDEQIKPSEATTTSMSTSKVSEATTTSSTSILTEEPPKLPLKPEVLNEEQAPSVLPPTTLTPSKLFDLFTLTEFPITDSITTASSVDVAASDRSNITEVDTRTMTLDVNDSSVITEKTEATTTTESTLITYSSLIGLSEVQANDDTTDKADDNGNIAQVHNQTTLTTSLSEVEMTTTPTMLGQ